jgi:hypothetical protein
MLGTTPSVVSRIDSHFFWQQKKLQKKLPHWLALRQIYRFFAKITKNDVAPERDE